MIYLPFEELPQRYTAMWNSAIKSAMSEDDIYVETDNRASVIKNGEFLDTYGTIAYKSAQMQRVAELFQQGKVKDGEVFFVPDIFYPGIEGIRYMADLTGISVKIAAFNHAGRADETDFVQRLGKWADIQEQSWHDLCDLVLVGSKFHARNVYEKFGTRNIRVVGAVWDKNWMDEMCKGIDRTKEDYVIYPHRPCSEKRFDLFLQVAEANPELTFVITSCGNSRLDESKLPKNVKYLCNLTKRQYFEVFAKARYFLTTALQETFGYTIQEAIYFGCKIVCPSDQPCYREFVQPQNRMSVQGMTAPGYLAYYLKQDDLCESKQFADNAKKIVELIKSL